MNEIQSNNVIDIQSNNVIDIQSNNVIDMQSNPLLDGWADKWIFNCPTYIDINIIDYQITNNIINDIISNNIIDLKYYDISNILLLNHDSIILILHNLVKIFYSNNYYTYKHTYYIPLIFLITNIIKNVPFELDLCCDNFNIINAISSVNLGHLYLKKIKNKLLIDKYKNINILFNITSKCTYQSFLFWWKFHKNKILPYAIYSNLLKLSIINSDDRIYKFIKDTIISDNNTEFDADIIVKLINSNIPYKYVLKRLKLLANKYDLSKYYTIMIRNSECIILINHLSKYYYYDILNFESLTFILNIKNVNIKELEIFYDNLKTQNEKNSFTILCNLNGFPSDKFKIFNLDYSILNSQYIYILSKLEANIVILYDKNIILNSIFKYYIKNNIISKYLQLNKNIYSIINISTLIKYTKFFIFNYNIQTKGIPLIEHNILDNIKINKILHLLRCCIKRKIRIKREYFKYNFKLILDELCNYKPNNKYQVLKNGSINYQIKINEFNLKTPRYLLPLENIINKIFIIKQKSTGILVNMLPLYIYPHSNELYKYEIKAKYIEDLNLYLILDINIPNTTIYERQLILRKMHYITINSNIDSYINTFDILKDKISIENQLLTSFINSTDTVKWYPQILWVMNINNKNYNDIKKIISGKLDITHNTIFNWNCFTLIPCDDTNELKIIPKQLLNIYLLFDGINWVDINKTVYKNIILKIIPKVNKIYKSYLHNDNNILYFIPDEIAYNKKLSSYKIIEQIKFIYNYNWAK